MNVKYKDGKLELNLHELLGSVSAEDKLDMVESLACDDEIIKHVADQIIKKWTENCYHGSTHITATVEPALGLDWAWREVAKRSGEVAKREIERLESAIRYKDKCYAAALEENRQLRRANEL